MHPDANPTSLAVLLGGALLLLLAGLLPTSATWSPEGLDRAQAWAGDDEDDEEYKSDDEEDEAPAPDLGDTDVPFSQQVNKAIEQGTKWLLARGRIFDIPGARDEEQGAHYGLIKGKTFYGGGDGRAYQHPAGPTALALYTLLKCDVEPAHGVIERGFNWLRVRHRITTEWDAAEYEGFTWTHTEAGSSYELAAIILALTAKYDQKKRTGTSRKKLRIRDKDDAEWLVELVSALVERRGQPDEAAVPVDRIGWRYNVPKITFGGGGGRARGGGGSSTTRLVNVPPHANQDLSSTQLAALALYNAQRFGVDVDPQVWLDIAEFTLAHQEEEGPEVERHDPGYAKGGYAAPKDHARGFMYIKGSTDRSEGKATGSMTACGMANLLMCQDVLANHKKTKRTYGTSPLAQQIETGILDAMAWLDLNWSSFDNRDSGVGYHTYYLYALERAMDMIGKNLVGKRLWYQEGAVQLLKRQRPASVEVPDKKMRTSTEDVVFWDTESTHEPYDVLDSCFALLYLKRATQGVMPPPAAVTGN